MITSAPGVYSWYPSSVVSEYYTWFCDLGYPNLDIIKHRDTVPYRGGYLSCESGEWSIIEYYNAPIIPSLTKWNYVLTGIRNTLITEAFVTDWVKKLDLRRKQYWDMCDEETRKMEEEHARIEKMQDEFATDTARDILRNEALMERVAKNGFQELMPENIFKHIPRHQKIGLK
jgi:hypothetical protein